MVSKGLISPQWMLVGTIICLLMAFCLGVILMEHVQANRILLGVGVVSVLSALAYTGGPFPLAYNGLGDCFVIFFFGLLAVCLTEYVLMCSARFFWIPSWGICLSVCLVINKLLVVNNYRDLEEDRSTGKNTLVVIFGRKFGVYLYAFGFLIASVGCSIAYENSRFTLLLIPLALFCMRKLTGAKEAKDYDNVLALSAVVLYALFIAFGIYGKAIR